MYNCIIFDVDGTIIDTEDAVISSYQKVIYEEFNRYFTLEEFARGYGVPTKEALDRYGMKNIEEALSKYHKYLSEAYSNIKAFKGIPQVIETLSKNNAITGIVTSRIKHEIEIDNSLKELMQYLKYSVCADDTKKHKPDSEPIFKFIELSGADIKKTIYIGDTYYDYICAKNAGVHFALAMWGAKTTEGIEADYYFKEPKEILDIFEA